MTAKKRILPVLVAVLMVFAMMPMSAGTVYAEESGTPAISSGAGILATDCNTENAATVYYGGKAWRVISFDGAGNEYTNPSGTMTLFSSDLLAQNVKFNPDWWTYTNEYAGSNLQKMEDQ